MISMITASGKQSLRNTLKHMYGNRIETPHFGLISQLIIEIVCRYRLRRISFTCQRWKAYNFLWLKITLSLWPMRFNLKLDSCMTPNDFTITMKKKSQFFLTSQIRKKIKKRPNSTCEQFSEFATNLLQSSQKHMQHVSLHQNIWYFYRQNGNG